MVIRNWLDGHDDTFVEAILTILSLSKGSVAPNFHSAAVGTMTIMTMKRHAFVFLAPLKTWAGENNIGAVGRTRFKAYSRLRATGEFCSTIL